MPPDGLNIRWPDPPLAGGAAARAAKMQAVRPSPAPTGSTGSSRQRAAARLGIVTTGKAYLDRAPGARPISASTSAAADALGIRVYKVG